MVLAASSHEALQHTFLCCQRLHIKAHACIAMHACALRSRACRSLMQSHCSRHANTVPGWGVFVAHDGLAAPLPTPTPAPLPADTQAASLDQILLLLADPLTGPRTTRGLPPPATHLLCCHAAFRSLRSTLQAHTSSCTMPESAGIPQHSCSTAACTPAHLLQLPVRVPTI